MAEYKVTGKKTDRRKQKRLSKQDKLMHRLKTNLVAEKGWSYSVLKSEKIFEANYKALWIADCIAWAITQKEGIEINWEKKQELLKDLGIDTFTEQEIDAQVLEQIDFLELDGELWQEIKKKLFEVEG
jgi:hypothetical protein